MRTRVALVLLCLLVPSVVFAGVPDFVTYSGRLTDGTGWGQSQTLDLTFRMYGSADGDDLLWQNAYPGLAVEDGYFSVLLGDGDNPATPEVVETDYNVTVIFAANDETWITVCVGEFPCVSTFDLSPRQQIGSVPYAMRAKRIVSMGSGSKVATNSVFRGVTTGHGDLGGNFQPDGKTAGAIKYKDHPTGYKSAKKACEHVLNSPTAHFCTFAEIAVSAELGLGPASPVWISGGFGGYSSGPPAVTYADCNGWTFGVDGCPSECRGGSVWVPSRPTTDLCGTANGLACCDFSVD